MFSEKKSHIMSIIMVITVLVIIVLSLNYSSKKELGKPYFIQFNSYVASQINTYYTLDFVFFIDKNKENIITSNNIERVEFSDINNAQIEKYEFKNGSVAKKYKIITLSITTKFTKAEKDTLKKLNIIFKNGEVKRYPVGNWIFDVSNGLFKDTDINIGNGYRVMTGKLDKYFLSLNNISDKAIRLEKLIINLDGIKYDFIPTTVNAYKSFYKEIDLYVKSNICNDNLFFFIRPRIEYSKEGVIYSYFPYGVNFGLLNINDSIIDLEVGKAINAE